MNSSVLASVCAHNPYTQLGTSPKDRGLWWHKQINYKKIVTNLHFNAENNDTTATLLGEGIILNMKMKDMKEGIYKE